MRRQNDASQLLSMTLPQRACELMLDLRHRRPRIHALTNTAAQMFTANLLLAAGAIPSLTIAPEEVEAFTGRSSALLVNLGTLDNDRRLAFPKAICAAKNFHRPWVLDPVFVDASPTRLKAARSLLSEHPDVLRCNIHEFDSFFPGTEPINQRIVSFAEKHHIVVALTGAVDTLSDGTRTINLANGHPMMALTTAMGCAGTALIAAFTALSDDRLEAAAAALLILGITGEIAGEITDKKSEGPGSFPARFLDTLYTLQSDDILKRANIS